MSGASSGFYPLPEKEKFDCDTGQITTSVSSIEISVLKKHTVEYILKVEVDEKGRLILIDGDGEILGSIIHHHSAEIIKCIKSGTTYKAKIVSINIPSCRVNIYSSYD